MEIPSLEMLANFYHEGSGVPGKRAIALAEARLKELNWIHRKDKLVNPSGVEWVETVGKRSIQAGYQEPGGAGYFVEARGLFEDA